jgi:hypothetical protein
LDLDLLSARLIIEPFHMSFAEIGELTDKQIFDICYHARDKDGQLTEKVEFCVKDETGHEDRQAKADALDKKTKYQQLRLIAAQLGWKEDKIQAVWRKRYPEG